MTVVVYLRFSPYLKDTDYLHIREDAFLDNTNEYSISKWTLHVGYTADEMKKMHFLRNFYSD